MIAYSHRIPPEEWARIGLVAASPPVPGRPNPEPDLPGPGPDDEGELPDDDSEDPVLRC